MTTETAAWEMRVAGQNFMALNIEHKPECSGMDIDGEVSVKLRCRECDGVAAANPDALDARADLAEALGVLRHDGYHGYDTWKSPLASEITEPRHIQVGAKNGCAACKLLAKHEETK